MTPITRDSNRLVDIVEAACQTFIAQGGYKRTQMSDVARNLGIAPGTLYLSVDSKMALFDLTVRGTFDPEWLNTAIELPFANSSPGGLEAFITREVEELGSPIPTLARAVASKTCGGHAELKIICGEFYDTLYHYRKTIKVIEACSKDFPGLTETWFAIARFQTLHEMEAYLEMGMTAGTFSDAIPANFAARQIMESIAFWAMHRHWDPAPAEYDAANARDYVAAMAAATCRAVANQ